MTKRMSDTTKWALQDADALQREAMPRWRDTLMSVFSKQTPGDEDVKAALVGAPGRRDMFRIGGVTLAGAAILAACGDSDDTSSNTTAAGSDPTNGTQGTEGTEPTTPGETTEPGQTTEPPSGDVTEMDLVLLRTATSLETSAINTYQAAIDGAADLGIGDAVAAAATLFQAHHVEHADALKAATTAAGGEAYEEPNAFIDENIITPALGELTDEASVVMLAATLEDAAASTYVLAGGALSTPTLRQTIMAIGGVEARHYAVLQGVLEENKAPFGFYTDANAAPEASFIAS